MLRHLIARRLAGVALFVALVACASGRPNSPASGSAAPSPGAPALPSVPLLEGPLAIHVQYPSANALVEARDSSFIFGHVGNGRATLTINGIPVPVLPNGSYLAFLPLPRADSARRDSARFDLVASLGPDTVRLVHPIRLPLPRPALTLDGPLVVDSASVTPSAGLMLRSAERVRVAVRAPANASVWLQLDSTAAGRVLLLSGAALPGARATGRDSTVLPRDSIARMLGPGDMWATDVPAAMLASPGQIIVARGPDTVRLAIPPIALTDTVPRLVILGADPAPMSDTDRVVFGRPQPDDTYKWFLLPGTRLELTGRSGDFVRVRLDAALEAWVLAVDARFVEAGVSIPPRVARNARVVAGGEWSDFVVPMPERPAHLITESERGISLTLYATRSSSDVTRFVSNDSLIRMVTWDQESSDRVRFTLQLGARPFGYLAFWDDARSAFVLRVRRPPEIRDSGSPLRGLTIAVDPGHPPIGATGPTGLYEGDAVLAVGERMRALLEQRGATVVMTRTTPDPVALADRPVMARRANAHALVSIHLNALPDGVNPFAAHGTETYFLHPQAEPLARAAQRRMVARMGLRNNGIYSRTLALARPTWMPSILAEGAYIMIPEQEAALRTPAYREAYARALVEALEDFFREMVK
jgi:N-acetylmuramoyl-L-alanine amidase